MIKVSIVTVCYNSEKTIERTLQSVLNQTYPNIEYIIVDGKSNDSTLDVITGYQKKFEEKKIEYKYISEKDEGMYDAMNKGISMASGDIIGILNSDDWYEKDTLNIVFNACKYHKADIYMGAIKLYNGNHVIIKYAKDRKYKTSRNFNHPAMFVTRDCYRSVGNYDKGNIHSDFGWYLRAIKRGMNLYVIGDVLTNYPIGGLGSKKSLSITMARIKTKYDVYEKNDYSKLYFIECCMQELLKYFLMR